MTDPRFAQLAHVLVNHSTDLQKNEHVLIESFDIPDDMIVALVRAVREAGAIPQVSIKHARVHRELLLNAQELGMEMSGSYEAFRMEKMDAYIGLRGTPNISELSDVSGESMQIYEKHWMKPVHYNIRVPNTKWVVLRWPSSSMAQLARKSTESFESFYFDVCTLDYGKMAEAQKPLAELMQKTDIVRIQGPGTDLNFCISNIPVVECSGKRNIPDGECFTAPIRTSVEGEIQFNTSTLYRGSVFDNIYLRFQKGKIVEAHSNNGARLNEILDSDEGARYIGEFAIGFNPYITDPILDILFDEKIAGSFHFTPGQAYEDADNGNRSTVHWDMVMIQSPEFGGGQIYFDDTLVRQDGQFVLEELKPLNPENLKKKQ
jgi:aminopeptidase